MALRSVDGQQLCRYSNRLSGMGTAMAVAIDSEVARVLQQVPQVEGVYVIHREGDLLRVFTAVNDEDDAVYGEIYDRELHLATKLAPVRFDFNVITRYGRPIQEFVGPHTPAWERPGIRG
jgi:hypothetical protein